MSKINHRVVIEIYKYCIIKKEPLYYSKLVDLLKDEISKSNVSKSIDFLTDICMIDAEFQPVEDGKWARCFSVDEDYEPFLEGLYKEAML